MVELGWGGVGLVGWGVGGCAVGRELLLVT